MTFAAQNDARAKAIGSKFKADLLGFGDLKSVANTKLPGSIVALAATGEWLIAVDGRNCQVLFAKSDVELAKLVATAGGTGWQPVPDRAYPRWLDCFDNAGTGVWWSGGGSGAQIPQDFEWARARNFTLTEFPPTEGRYIAPGVIDTSITDWFGTMAAKYDLAYRSLLWGHKPEWAWNRTPLPYLKPVDYAAPQSRPYFARWSVYDSPEPVAVTARYSGDFRRRFSESVASDPNYIGGHALGEVPDAGVAELAAVGNSPGVKELWHSYLSKSLGFDLQSVSLRHTGKPDSYKTWSDVPIAGPETFLGLDSHTVRLNARGTAIRIATKRESTANGSRR